MAWLVESVVVQMEEVSQVYCWTDSMTVLHWIKNKHVYRPYVQNRIDEIRQKTNGCLWQHCPGNINPADLPSRGIKASDLIKASLWWEGPQFLKLPHSEWPEASLQHCRIGKLQCITKTMQMHTDRIMLQLKITPGHLYIRRQG